MFGGRPEINWNMTDKQNVTYFETGNLKMSQLVAPKIYFNNIL